jgi:2-keto-4-pentenoate hydratase
MGASAGTAGVDPEAVAASLWQEMQAGRHMPEAWRGRLSIDDAYRAQLALLARYEAAGERHAGWKVGLNAAAMRAQQGVHEPCFGFLLASGRRPGGHAFRFDDLIAPGFENELCLRVGTRLAGPGVTLEAVARAVTHAAPALEIIEKRGAFAGDLPLSMADNAQQKAYVTGAEVALDAANGDLGRARVAVHVNGAMQEEASGAEVMGAGALLSVQWLADKLAQFGRAIEPGALIMSGSFTRQYPIARGDAVESRFAPFGTVTARFD